MEKDERTPHQSDLSVVPREETSEDEQAANEPRKPVSKAVWMGTAAGIGSAAIVAALLYAKRRN